jgi:hypothetical protein
MEIAAASAQMVQPTVFCTGEGFVVTWSANDTAVERWAHEEALRGRVRRYR